MSARGVPPGRSSSGVAKQPTMVDSTPTETGPPSMIRSMRPARSLATCAAAVGETWPDRFAEGATIGCPSWHSHGVQPGGGQSRDRAIQRLRQHQRQRAGPERFGEAARGGIETRDALGGGKVCDMGNQRIERGSPLGLIKPGNGLRMRRVGAEAVDRLGGKRHQATVGEAPGGLGGRHGARSQHFCC